MEMRDFFISYTKADRAEAEWIANTLTEHGYTVYIQMKDIMPGDNFLDRMNEFLKNVRGVIAVWSRKYAESGYCMTEFKAAFNEWHKKNIERIIPVSVENYPMEPLYSALVRAEVYGVSDTEKKKRLLNAVGYPIPPNPPKPDTHQILLAAVVLGVSIVLATLIVRLPDIIKTLKMVEPNPSAESSEIAPLLPALPIPDTQSGDYIEDLEANTLYALGENFYYGKWVEQDYEKAMEYHKQAADKGVAGSLYRLGYMYDLAEGVEQDYDKAQEYYEEAAEVGHPDAIFRLGYMYEEARGVKRDYSRAREYYEQAAEKGSAAAFYRLGHMYEYGEDVEQDYKRALEYYERAAEKGDASALNSLGIIYEQGNFVKQDYAKAREYLEQAAELGHGSALNSLGYMYEYGEGVEQDYTKAREYYQQAVDKGEMEYASENLTRVQEKLNNA